MRKSLASVCLAAALVLPAAPVHAGPIVRTEECPPGMVGRTIHIGDNTSVRNCYPLPEAPADAEGSDAWWGRKPCPSSYVGTIIWHDTPATEYEEIWLCIPPIYPDDRTASPTSYPAGVYHCGGTGYIVWYYDLEGRYQEPVNTCI